MAFTQEPLEMFQSLMCRSAVPPPEASITGFQGHQAKAYRYQTKLYYSFGVTINLFITFSSVYFAYTFAQNSVKL